MKNIYEQAALTLLKNRTLDQKKSARLSISDRPNSSEQAFVIQNEMIKLRADDVAAWKCLLPLNDKHLVAAPIFSDTLNRGNRCDLFANNNNVSIEPEIAFVLGCDLPARETGYSEAEVDLAVKSCHMALELMQDRFSTVSDLSFYEKLADCLVNQGLYIGPEIDKKSAYRASKFKIKIDQGTNQKTLSGEHPNSLPQKPLYWLINFMSKRGVSFIKGQAIITGSYAGIVDVEFDKATDISYEGLGSYQVTFNKI